jgi:hypothetical protein
MTSGQATSRVAITVIVRMRPPTRAELKIDRSAQAARR